MTKEPWAIVSRTASLTRWWIGYATMMALIRAILLPSSRARQAQAPVAVVDLMMSGALSSGMGLLHPFHGECDAAAYLNVAMPETGGLLRQRARVGDEHGHDHLVRH